MVLFLSRRVASTHPFLLCAMLAVALGSTGTAAAQALRLAPGDRVVLVGNTLIERAQKYGYIETMLTASAAGRDVTFRNLGWSGDTVGGVARAGFDPPEKGYARLLEQVAAAEPSVLVIGYGMNASFEGEAGKKPFEEGLERLLVDLGELIDSPIQTVLVTPNPHEPMPPPLPPAAPHNAALAEVSEIIAQVAERRGLPVIDLFTILSPSMRENTSAPWTDNGIHLTARGYQHLAARLAEALNVELEPWRIVIRDGDHVEATGTRVSDVKRTEGGVRFTALDPVLPPPWTTDAESSRRLEVHGLPAGSYDLLIDDTRRTTATADRWAAGVALDDTPQQQQTEALRSAIIKKNKLFFHRWRPQNTTYLFGFRKHEQGQNAVEVPRFDPLVAEAEEEIARLRVPQAHTYRLVRAGEVAK